VVFEKQHGSLPENREMFVNFEQIPATFCTEVRRKVSNIRFCVIAKHDIYGLELKSCRLITEVRAFEKGRL